MYIELGIGVDEKNKGHDICMYVENVISYNQINRQILVSRLVQTQKQTSGRKEP